MPDSTDEAVLKALKAHLDTPLPAAMASGGDTEYPGAIARGIEIGWPEAHRDLLYPAITVDVSVPPERDSQAPRVISETPGAGADTVCLIKTAFLSYPVQVNIFAKSRDERERLVRSIEASMLAGYATGSSQVCVTAEDYFAQPISMFRDGGVVRQDNPQAVGGHEWRALLTIRAEVAELIQVSASRLVDLNLKMQVGEYTRADTAPVVDVDLWTNP